MSVWVSIIEKISSFKTHLTPFCRHGIEATFVRLFQVFSGSVNPSSVGLNDNRDIRRLLKFKPAFELLKVHNSFSPQTMSLLLIIDSFVLFEDLFTTLIYGVPHAIWMAVWAEKFFDIILWQFFYYNLICLYFKIKIKNLNVVVLKQNNNLFAIQPILRQFNGIYAEIDEYNTNYWSKFLFTIWLWIGSIAGVSLYMVLFRQLFFFYRLFLSYGVLLSYGLLHFIFITAASLNLEAKRSHKYFNTILAKHSNDTKFVMIARFNQRFKVFQFFNMLILNLHIISKE